MANKKTTEINEVKEVKNKEELKEVEVATQKISSKNILIICGVILLIILFGIYIFHNQKLKNEKKLGTSYLIDSGTLSLEIKNLDEVNQILTESPNEYFVLISYTGNEDTYNLETGLKTVIDKYKLNDSFYYLNVKDIMDEDNYLNRINNAFNTDKIKTVPIILYYKDGKIIDTVTRYDNNPINASDFQKLLDIYEYEGQ